MGMTQGRIAELRGLAASEAEDDRALQPAAILELIAEVERCQSLIAALEQHAAVVSAELEALTTVES